ncbi:hypothetical protein BDV06DRAFT_203646 [Aspergillus oleicola]
MLVFVLVLISISSTMIPPVEILGSIPPSQPHQLHQKPFSNKNPMSCLFSDERLRISNKNLICEIARLYFPPIADSCRIFCGVAFFSCPAAFLCINLEQVQTKNNFIARCARNKIKAKTYNINQSDRQTLCQGLW